MWADLYRSKEDLRESTQSSVSAGHDSDRNWYLGKDQKLENQVIQNKSTFNNSSGIYASVKSLLKPSVVSKNSIEKNEFAPRGLQRITDDSE